MNYATLTDYDLMTLRSQLCVHEDRLLFDGWTPDFWEFRSTMRTRKDVEDEQDRRAAQLIKASRR